MIIVNKKEFYNLPSGTLYSEFKPMCFTDLKIKQETLKDNKGNPIDFFYENLIGNIESVSSGDFYDKLEEAIKNKVSLPMNFSDLYRDGLFDDSQMFAIYETQDLEGLINKLKYLVKSRIDDLELLRDDIILATGLPRNFYKE